MSGASTVGGSMLPDCKIVVTERTGSITHMKRHGGTLRRALSATVAIGLLSTAVAVGQAPASAAPSASPSTTVSESEALSEARSTGKAVEITASTTATQQSTANPDGTITLTQSALPARKRVDGVWQDLDPTL